MTGGAWRENPKFAILFALIAGVLWASIASIVAKPTVLTGGLLVGGWIVTAVILYGSTKLL